MTTSVDAYREAAARQMPERELQENVRQLCKQLGALYYHTHRSQHSPSGFPDCVIVTTDERMIVAELKTQDKDPTPEQQEWIDALTLIFQVVDDLFTVHVWRPMDWLDGTIERIVTGEEQAA